MPRERYQTQLAELRENILAMSTLVTKQFRRGLDALETREEGFVQTVIENDTEVNDRYLDIENDCIDLFALQQPVAGDLRFVAASFKISTDLERIADLAVNLAEYSIEAKGEAFPTVDLHEIGTVAVKMLGDAMDAYVTEDVWACHEVASSDDELDALCKRSGKAIIRTLIETETRHETAVEDLIQNVFWLALAIRDIERIGDHAVNIAARTLYMSENDDELIQ
jgi:phosphate transport system protein